MNCANVFKYTYSFKITNFVIGRIVSTIIAGAIKNAKKDFLEIVPCLDIIPEDRPDWERYCIGIDHSINNHRLII